MVNSNSLNDKLKPELEDLAAGILRENKNVKKVKIEGEIKMKTARTGTGKSGRGPETGQKSESGPSAGSAPSASSPRQGSGQAGQAGEEQGEKSESGPSAGSAPSASSPRQGSGQAGQAGEEQGEKSEEPEEGEKGKKNSEEGDKKDSGEKNGEKEGQDGGEKDDGEREGKEPEKKSDKGQEKPEGQKDSQAESGGGTGQPEKKDPSVDSAPSASSGQDGSQQAGSPRQGSGQAGQAGQDKGGLDNRLLNPEEEDGAAGRLKQDKSESKKAESEAGEGGEPSSAKATEDEPKSLRERVMQARQAMNLKETAKRKLEEKIAAPAKQGLSQLLKAAWLNLIDSFGLTLIWINLHVFLRWSVSDKLFCALGEEWLPKQVTAAGGDAAKTAGKGIGLLEIIVLLILDFIVLAVILGVLALIVMIVDFMQASWYEKIYLFIGGLTKLGWSGISALYDLF